MTAERAILLHDSTRGPGTVSGQELAWTGDGLEAYVERGSAQRAAPAPSELHLRSSDADAHVALCGRILPHSGQLTAR